MRTFTGPLPGGETVTVTCPPWCAAKHGDDPAGDIIHTTEPVTIVPPGDVLTGRLLPQMRAEVAVPAAMVPGRDRPTLFVGLSADGAEFAELDLGETDELLRQLDAYRASLRTMRDVMATAGGAP